MHILLSAKTSCQHYIRKFNCHDSDTLVGDVRSGIHDIVFKLSSNAVTQAQGLICLCGRPLPETDHRSISPVKVHVKILIPHGASSASLFQTL